LFEGVRGEVVVVGFEVEVEVVIDKIWFVVVAGYF